MSASPYSNARWLDRRDFLAHTSSGLGAMALTSLLGSKGLLAAQAPSIDPSQPHAPRPGPGTCVLAAT